MTSLALKLIAALLMLVDHIYWMIPDVPVWFSWLGRLSAPVFFYLSVEGFFRTHNRKNYMIRLFAFGVLMVLLDYLLNIENNIFLSLGCGIAMLSCLEKAKTSEKSLVYLLGAVAIAAASLFTEASVLGIGMMLIFYYFHENKKTLCVIYVAFSFLLILPYIGQTGFFNTVLTADWQWMMAFAFPFFLAYNGEKGKGGAFAKWFFYIFYPLHLTLLWVIGNIL